jgi:hypothetical protein
MLRLESKPRPRGSDSGVVVERVVEHKVANFLSVYTELLQSFSDAIRYPVASIGPRELWQIDRNVPKVTLSGGKQRFQQSVLRLTTVRWYVVVGRTYLASELGSTVAYW